MASKRGIGKMLIGNGGCWILLWATAAIGCRDAAVQSKGYESPQEAGEAFIAAMTRKDWKTGFRCFAPEDRDLVIAHLITMTRFVTARAEKAEQAAEALLKKHGFEPAKAEEAVKTASIGVEANQDKPDWKPVVKAFVDQIKDKELLFASTLTWLDQDYGGDRKVGACSLQELKATEDAATGQLNTGSAHTVHFRKVDGRWFMALPEEQYRLSGWNDVFLMDFLDALHGWRL
jgi:hypothetical protein